MKLFKGLGTLVIILSIGDIAFGGSTLDVTILPAPMKDFEFKKPDNSPGSGKGFENAISIENCKPGTPIKLKLSVTDLKSNRKIKRCPVPAQILNKVDPIAGNYKICKLPPIELVCPPGEKEFPKIDVPYVLDNDGELTRYKPFRLFVEKE